MLASITQPMRFADDTVSRRTLVLFISLSFAFHLILLVSFVVIPGLVPSKRFIPKVVNVSLVSLPAAGQPTVRSPAPVATPKPTRPQAVTPQPSSASPKVSVAETGSRKPKTSLKHKTFKAEKVLENKITRMEQQVEETRHPSIEEALERLKREVAQSETNPRSTSVETQVPSEADQADGGAVSGSGAATGDEMDRLRIYQAEIAYQIQKNWAFSEQLAGGRTDLEAALGIRIMPDGEIKEIWFDQRSGNRHLDDSAYRAVVKSSPLPPLPRGLFDDHYLVGLKFGPKGLKR
jgi:colicin import membrane protein